MRASGEVCGRRRADEGLRLAQLEEDLHWAAGGVVLGQGGGRGRCRDQADAVRERGQVLVLERKLDEGIGAFLVLALGRDAELPRRGADRRARAEVGGRQEDQVIAVFLDCGQGGPVAVPLQGVAAIDETSLAVSTVLRGARGQATLEQALARTGSATIHQRRWPPDR